MTAIPWIAAVALAILTITADAQKKPVPKNGAAPTASRPGIRAKTDRELVGYALGVSMARNVNRHGVDIDIDAVVLGVKDALQGKPLRMTDVEVQRTLSAFQAQLIRQQSASRAEAATVNKKEGAAFLAANARKPGVVTLPSGLQYKVLKTGTGTRPTIDQTVFCHYRGTLVDGTEFDSTVGRPEPPPLAVSGMIAGVREALLLMPVGSKWQVCVPSALAYGPKRAGRVIGPNAVLLFELELLATK